MDYVQTEDGLVTVNIDSSAVGGGRIRLPLRPPAPALTQSRFGQVVIPTTMHYNTLLMLDNVNYTGLQHTDNIYESSSSPSKVSYSPRLSRVIHHQPTETTAMRTMTPIPTSVRTSQPHLFLSVQDPSSWSKYIPREPAGLVGDQDRIDHQNSTTKRHATSPQLAIFILEALGLGSGVITRRLALPAY